MMKVRVNSTKCMGERLCAKVCPQVFEVDEWGFAYAPKEEVPAEYEESARIAIKNCPMDAIVILEEKG